MLHNKNLLEAAKNELKIWLRIFFSLYVYSIS